MIRRFSAALIGLALCIPIFAVAPVAAHTNGGLAVTLVDSYTDAEGTHVTGVVTNHTSSRRSPITVTAVWEMGTTDVSQSGAAFINNLAPHASTSFHLLETESVVGNTGLVVTAAGSITGTKPTAGIHIGLSDITGDQASVALTNDSAGTLAGVVVSARRSGGTNDGAAQSAPLAIGSLATVVFTIDFDADSDGAILDTISARSTSGTLGVTWNNYFGDLGLTNFTNEIAFLADEGITLGCGNSNFCPAQSVTRESMAVFLDRALGFVDDPDPTPFTDIGGLSTESQQAIQNLYGQGITGGCTATTYCPGSSVTRGQMSKFISLAYDLAAPVSDHFTDDTGHFSEPYNNQMFEAGITTGCSTGKYCPNSNVLRDQMARFLFVAEGL